MFTKSLLSERHRGIFLAYISSLKLGDEGYRWGLTLDEAPAIRDYRGLILRELLESPRTSRGETTVATVKKGEEHMAEQKVKDPTIQRMVEYTADVNAGNHEVVKPGMPFHLNKAATPDVDGVCQGDLYIRVISKVPENYTKAKKPFLQLVPGNTIGAHHCLDSLDGVELFLPPNWPQCADNEFIGPVMRLSEKRVIKHPRHGDITIDGGMTVDINYQLNYDDQLKAERRAAD